MNHATQSSEISSTELQAKVGTVVRRLAVSKEHLTIKHYGIPIGVIIPFEDYMAVFPITAQKPTSQTE